MGITEALQREMKTEVRREPLLLYSRFFFHCYSELVNAKQAGVYRVVDTGSVESARRVEQLLRRSQAILAS